MQKEERWGVAAKLEMGGRHGERMKYEGFGSSILKICII